MSDHPVSHEVAACFGAFFTGGSGPTHSALSRVFDRTGYGDAAPYRPPDLEPNKEDRVRTTILAAEEDPAEARDLVERLLAELRADRYFTRDEEQPEFERTRRARVADLRRAFARIDWELTDDGELRPGHGISVSAAAGRPAVEEQLVRLRRASGDPALLLGTAKEMLESTAKYVLEEFGVSYTQSGDFGQLWYLARDRLGIHPKDIDTSVPGGAQVRKITQSAWTIAEQVNELRGEEGTGHGRTLPSGVSPEMALYVVREACSMVEFTLQTLDRRFGR